MVDYVKLNTFLKKHIKELNTLCKNEYKYGWDYYKAQIDPLKSINEALGVDNTELDRACQNLENAQLHLRSVRDEYLIRLEKKMLKVEELKEKEDLT